MRNDDESRRELAGGIQGGGHRPPWPARDVVRQTVCWPTGVYRLAFTPPSSSQDETSDKSAPVQPEVATTDELAEQVRGGDRRIARRESRGTRVTVRLSDEESAQLARVANRYRLAESGAIRAAVDYLDGGPRRRRSTLTCYVWLAR